MSGDVLADLGPAVFEPHLGSTFAVSSGDEVLTELRLDDVTLLPARLGSPRSEPFSLAFSGLPPVLEQRIYRLDHHVLGTLEIFLVPIASDADRVRYEAVFN